MTQRVILHTVAGDILLKLYPEAAPKTVAQFLELVRHGVYDLTHFRRYEPGFVLQLGEAHERVVPLNPVQKALIRPIPAEFSRTLRHKRGILSMARRDGEPDSGETSFSILLGDAPHLDGKYTIFGEVEAGMEVVQELERVPRQPDGSPLVRLTVNYAEAVRTNEELAAKFLTKPLPLVAGMRQVQGTGIAVKTLYQGPLLAAVAAGLFFSVLLLLLRRRLPPAKLFCLAGLHVLVASFALFVHFVPVAAGSPWLGAATFVGLVGLFRLMSFFEPAQ